MESIESVLAFWFGNELDDAQTARSQATLWWSKQDAIDAAIRARFASWVERAAKGELADWGTGARGALALTILFDQLPRNMHRGTPRAFAHDAQAVRQAGDAVDRGFDQILRPIERVFLYLPFEHAESITDQERAVALFDALANTVAPQLRETFDGYLDYAKRHRAVIARFGRFPHRNAILGRTSTEAEAAFLATPGSSF